MGGKKINFGPVANLESIFDLMPIFVYQGTNNFSEESANRKKQNEKYTFRTFTNFVFQEICHSADYDRQDVHPQSQPGVRARVRRSSQDGDSQQQEAGPLFLPQLNSLHEAFHVRGEDASNMPTIPLTTGHRDTN